jgi:tRNA A-37 threonylcarbamoyl transferase component Bud32
MEKNFLQNDQYDEILKLRKSKFLEINILNTVDSLQNLDQTFFNNINKIDKNQKLITECNIKLKSKTFTEDSVSKREDLIKENLYLIEDFEKNTKEILNLYEISKNLKNLKNYNFEESLQKYKIEEYNHLMKKYEEIKVETNGAFENFQKSILKEKEFTELMKYNFYEYGLIIFDEKGFDFNEEKIKHIIEMLTKYEKEKNQLIRSKDKKDLAIDILNKWKQNQIDIRESQRLKIRLTAIHDEFVIDGGSKEKLLEIRKKIDEAKYKISILNEKSFEYKNILMDIIENYCPEVEKDIECNNLIPYKIMDMDIEIKRSLNDYIVDEKIANNVMLVRYADKKYVLKKFFITNQKERKSFLNEINALYKLNHPCIIKIQNYFIENENVYLQSDYYENGNFQLWLKKEKRDLKTIIRIFHQISNTILYCHNNGIIHCDIKPQNIVIYGDEEDRVKPILIDFDISKDIYNSLTKSISVKGTEGYVSPEVYSGQSQPTFQSDTWSFGAMLFRFYFKKEIIIKNGKA